MGGFFYCIVYVCVMYVCSMYVLYVCVLCVYYVCMYYVLCMYVRTYACMHTPALQASVNIEYHSSEAIHVDF